MLVDGVCNKVIFFKLKHPEKIDVFDDDDVAVVIVPFNVKNSSE